MIMQGEIRRLLNIEASGPLETEPVACDMWVCPPGKPSEH